MLEYSFEYFLFLYSWDYFFFSNFLCTFLPRDLRGWWAWCWIPRSGPASRWPCGPGWSTAWSWSPSRLSPPRLLPLLAVTWHGRWPTLCYSVCFDLADWSIRSETYTFEQRKITIIARRIIPMISVYLYSNSSIILAILILASARQCWVNLKRTCEYFWRFFFNGKPFSSSSCSCTRWVLLHNLTVNITNAPTIKKRASRCPGNENPWKGIDQTWITKFTNAPTLQKKKH